MVRKEGRDHGDAEVKLVVLFPTVVFNLGRTERRNVSQKKEGRKGRKGRTGHARRNGRKNGMCRKEG
jgi:hypothetical protein